GAAAGHPHVQRELILMLACEDLVTDAADEIRLRVAEPAGLVVNERSRLLDDRIGGGHLPGNQGLPRAEGVPGPLRLRSPELVGRDIDGTEAVTFDPGGGHGGSLETDRPLKGRSGTATGFSSVTISKRNEGTRNPKERRRRVSKRNAWQR